MFTTLSTVGLGDYHPVNNAERAFGSFILLFGVLVTSIVIENFTNMIKSYSAYQKSYKEVS